MTPKSAPGPTGSTAGAPTPTSPNYTAWPPRSRRNRNLDTVLAGRITTSSMHAHVPTIVPLTAVDPPVGFVLVDDIVQLYHDELTESLGTLSPPTIAEISRALQIALP